MNVLLGLCLAVFSIGAEATHLQAVPADPARTVESLLESMKSPDAGVRAASARALGEIATESKQAKESIPALGLALKDGDVGVRENAARALGQIGPSADATVPALVESLRDVDARVRKAAAMALGRIGDAGATEALKVARKDPNKEVQASAKAALKRLKDRKR